MIKTKQKGQQNQSVVVKINLADKPKKRRAPRKKGSLPASKPGKPPGDTVFLRPGNVMPPAPTSGQRFAYPGNSYASIPAPLQRSSYASSPYAEPLSTNSFLVASNALYNRNRNKSDDVIQVVNPSDITADQTPSRRATPSLVSSTPKGPYITSPQPTELPRINSIQITPSMRAIPSAPPGQMNYDDSDSDSVMPMESALPRINDSPAPRSMSSAEAISMADDFDRQLEETATPFKQSVASAFFPGGTELAPRIIKRPKTAIEKSASAGVSDAGKQEAKNPFLPAVNPRNSTDELIKLARSVGIKNPREQFSGKGFTERLKLAIAEKQFEQESTPNLRRGGVF